MSRHTWQSWRERYKKNSARLDVAIANIVSRRPVVPGEKGQYGYVRLVEERGKKPKKAQKQGTPAPFDLHNASIPAQSAPIMVGGTSSTVTLEESQEGSEWAIRIGDAPPPAWGKKRSLSQEGRLEDDSKRRRLDSGCVFHSSHPKPSSIMYCSLTPFSRSSFEHHVRVKEIATRFQFTPSEVGAYFSSVNQDVERTRRRFEKARELLDGMSDVE